MEVETSEDEDKEIIEVGYCNILYNSKKKT